MMNDQEPTAQVIYPTRVGFSYALGLLGLISKVIRFFTKAPCSHVWLLYWDHDFECDMVMEAHLEWHLMPFTEFKKKNHVVKIFVPSIPIDSGLKYAASLLGSRYDVEGLFGNLWIIIGEWLKRKWHNPFHSDRTVFCSEGVARTMIAAKYPGLEAIYVEDIRPEHLLALLEKDGSRQWNTEIKG